MPKRVYAGSYTIKLVFFKVKSGLETEVYDDLEIKLRIAAISNYKIYKVFGKFDLLLIYQSGDKSLLFRGLIPHVVYSEVFDCFTWKTKNDHNLTESFEFKRLDMLLLGMVFLKVKPKLFKMHEAEVDLRLIEVFNKHKIMLLGGFGWNDAIILSPENSIVKLEEKINVLSNLYFKTGEETTRLSSETFSMVCLDFEYCKNILQKKRKINSKKTQIEKDLMTDIFAELLVIFNPECGKYIVTALQKNFKTKGHFSLERPEIILAVKNLSWPVFIHKLLTFRKDNKEKICETYVNIATNKKQTFKEDSAELFETNQLIDIDKYISKIKEDDFGRNLLTILYSINHYSLDASIYHVFANVCKFITKLLEVYLENFGRDKLSKLIDLVRIAAVQRLSGSDIFKKDAFVTFYDYKGGIQKILSAIEILPKNLLSYLDCDWAGFVVVGSAPDYRHDMDIINIPSKVTLYPSQWWGIFHETGHIFGLENKSFNDDILIEYAKKCCDTTNSIDGTKLYDVGAGTQFGTIIRTFMEFIADSFDFRFCFLAKEDLYIETIWSYLLNEHRDRLKSDVNTYLVRTFFAISINNCVQREIAEYDIEDEILDRIIAKINKMPDSQQILERVEEDNIKYATYNMIPFMLYVANVLKEKNNIFADMKNYYESKEFKKVSTFIKNGCVFYNKIKFPHLVILSMLEDEKSQESNGLPSRLAAIKTLWYQSLLSQ